MHGAPRLTALAEEAWDERHRAVLEPIFVGPTRNI
jgi:hypothetical protein